MKRYPTRTHAPGYGDDAAERLSIDPEIPSLFHSFSRAWLSGEIAYPSGKKIKPVPSYVRVPLWWEPRYDGNLPWQEDFPWPLQKALDPGEERLIPVLSWVEPWRVRMVRVPFAAGQLVDVAVQHGSGIFRNEAEYLTPGPDFQRLTIVERMVNITETDNATIFRDLEWAYRRKWETKLTAMLANETARISVPDEPAETVFEFLHTCTGGYEMAEVNFKLKGT